MKCNEYTTQIPEKSVNQCDDFKCDDLYTSPLAKAYDGGRYPWK